MKYPSQNGISLRLGRQVVSLRKKNNMSQADLCYEADIDLSTLSRLERGKLNVTLFTLSKIADTLNVRLGALFE